jgi:hypothetical protein
VIQHGACDTKDVECWCTGQAQGFPCAPVSHGSASKWALNRTSPQARLPSGSPVSLTAPWAITEGKQPRHARRGAAYARTRPSCMPRPHRSLAELPVCRHMHMHRWIFTIHAHTQHSALGQHSSRLAVRCVQREMSPTQQSSCKPYCVEPLHKPRISQGSGLACRVSCTRSHSSPASSFFWRAAGISASHPQAVLAPTPPLAWPCRTTPISNSNWIQQHQETIAPRNNSTKKYSTKTA